MGNPFGGGAKAIPVKPPAPLFPGISQQIAQQGPGAISTATGAMEGAASGVDVKSIYDSIVQASQRQEATGRSNIAASMGAAGMASSSDAMKQYADYETQFQANLLSQLQQMQFQSEGLKLAGAQGLMETYGSAGMAFAPTQEVVGGMASPFQQATGAASGVMTAIAALLAA